MCVIQYYDLECYCICCCLDFSLVSNVSNWFYDFYLLLSDIHYQKGNKNQSGLKIFKPRINFNHNVCMFILLLVENLALVFHSQDI